MAFLNEIGAGRYNRFFQKLLNMKGGPPTRSLGSDMIPVLPVMHGRENRYLEDWRSFGCRSSIAGVAAQDTVIRLNNPLGSNVIAVIEGLTFFALTANFEVVTEHASSGNNGNLAGTFTPAAFESRFNPPGTGTNGAACVISGATNIAQGNHFIFGDYDLVSAGAISNELINYENQEIQVLPGADVQFRSLTLNLSLVVNWRWRERPLEDSEFK